MNQPRFSQHDFEPQRCKFRILRPGTEVTLIHTPPLSLRGVITGVELSASGYRALYCVAYWHDGVRVACWMEPCELIPEDDRPDNWIEVAV